MTKIPAILTYLLTVMTKIPAIFTCLLAVMAKVFVQSIHQLSCKLHACSKHTQFGLQFACINYTSVWSNDTSKASRIGSNGSLLMEKGESLKDRFKWIFTDGKGRKPQGWVQMDLYWWKRETASRMGSTGPLLIETSSHVTVQLLSVLCSWQQTIQLQPLAHLQAVRANFYPPTPVTSVLLLFRSLNPHSKLPCLW